MSAHRRQRSGTLRRATRIAGIGVAALGVTLATLQAPAGAVTVPLGTYTASLPLSPYPTVAGSTDPSGIGFPVTFKNTSPNGYSLSEVQITLPAGFSAPSAATVSTSGWTVSVSGNTVSASTSNPLSNGIPAGSTTLLSFKSTAPTAAGSYTFVSAAQGIVASTGVAGDFTNSGSDPTVRVDPYANVVTCAPSEVCDTGTQGSSSDTQARIVTTTGTSQDVLGMSVDPASDQQCLGRMYANGHSQQVTFQDSDTSRTLTETIRLNKSVVNQVPNNGASKYSVCWNTAGNHSHLTFVDRNGNVVTSGFLPMCSTPGLPADNPCIVSITKNQAGDVVITIRTPGGDPSNIAGIPLP
jgi:hypothetical protein